MTKRLCNVKKDIMEQVVSKADEISDLADILWDSYEKDGELTALNEAEYVDQQSMNELYKWKQKVSRLYWDIEELLKDNKDPIIRVLLDELDKATDEMANCISELMDGQYDSTDMREITYEIFDTFCNLKEYCK